MHKGNAVIKLPLYPSLEEKDTLDGQSRIVNWLYNRLLDTAIDLREKYIQTQDPATSKTLYTKRGLRNLIPKLKSGHPFLKVVHSSPLKNAALRLTESIQSYQKAKKGKRKGKKLGFPTYRSWKRNWFSLLYDEPNKGFKLQDKVLSLSLGKDEKGKQRKLAISIDNTNALKNKTIRNLRITKELGKYYAIFTITKELPQKKPIKRILALDPNHKNLSYGVDNKGKAIEIAAPNWLKKFDKRIDEIKHKRDRCQRKSRKLPVLDTQGKLTGKSYFLPSKRWNKFNILHAKALTKRREQTKTFLYTIANSLCKEYDCISIGDYTPDGSGITKPMRRAMNNRSLIGRYKKVLAWVAKKSGKTFLEYNEKGTTRTCHKCYYTLKEGLAPSIREWQCPSCATKHHRDENAAQNGFDETLKLLKKSEIDISQVPGSGRPPVRERWAWCAFPSGVVTMPRGKGCDPITTPGNSTTSVVACDRKIVDCQV